MAVWQSLVDVVWLANSISLASKGWAEHRFPVPDSTVVRTHIHESAIPSRHTTAGPSTL